MFAHAGRIAIVVSPGMAAIQPQGANDHAETTHARRGGFHSPSPLAPDDAPLCIPGMRVLRFTIAA